MSNHLRILRGLESARTTTLGIPLQGELVYTTDGKKLFIGDGTTAGGNYVIPGIVDNSDATWLTVGSDESCAFTGDVTIGTNDTEKGILSLYAGATLLQQPEFRLYTTADYDTTIDYWVLHSFADGFRLGPNTDDDYLYLESDGTVSIQGGSTVSTLQVGINDVKKGSVYIFGGATGATNGGSLYLYTAGDQDGVISWHNFRIDSDNLVLGNSDLDYATIYNDGDCIWASNFTVDGAFTSVGIDDNATGIRLVVADTKVSIGDNTSAATAALVTRNSDGALQISSTSNANTGSNILMYGSAHASAANDMSLRAGTNAFLRWDESAGSLELLTGTGAKTTALTIDSSQAATFAGDVDVLGGSLEVGVNDTTRGVINVRGDGTGIATGGSISLFTSADYDTTVEQYRWVVNNDDLLLQQNASTTFASWDQAGNLVQNYDLTVNGAFTSIGIDDNCTGERLNVHDGQTYFGTTATDYAIVKIDTAAALTISGGNVAGDGAAITLRGSTDTNGSDMLLKSDNQTFMHWDESAGTLTLSGGTGTKTRSLSVYAGSVNIGDGTSADTGVLLNSINDGMLHINGSWTAGQGGNVKLYASNHATQANDTEIAAAGNTWLHWDESAGELVISTGTAAKTTALTVQNSQNIVASANATIKGGSVFVGESDTTSGNLYLYGADALQGGSAYFYNGATADTDNEYWQAYLYNDTFRIRPQNLPGANLPWIFYPDGRLEMYSQGDTVADAGYNAFLLTYAISGDVATTTDTWHRGINIDIDSSATGGDVNNEHRIGGVVVNITATGDSDLIYGSYMVSNASHSSGTVSTLVGTYNTAQSYGTSTTVVGAAYGSLNMCYENNAGVTSAANGSYNKVLKQSAATGTTANAYGTYSEVEIDEGAGNISTAYGVLSRIDNDRTTSPTTAIGNAILFYGDYQGTLPGTSWGVYIPTSGIKHQMSGFAIETDGTLNVSAVTNYENLVTADDDIPNKKYVDDAITAGNGLITLGTEQASTSGTSIDFTIPANVKCIKVMFSGVSTSGTSDLLLQVGTSSTPQTSGYTASSIIFGATTLATASSTAGFNVYINNAGDTHSGHFELCLEDGTNHVWTCTGMLGNGNTKFHQTAGGHSGLSGAIDIVRITTVNGTDTFDAGAINIQYEL